LAGVAAALAGFAAAGDLAGVAAALAGCALACGPLAHGAALGVPMCTHLMWSLTQISHDVRFEGMSVIFLCVHRIFFLTHAGQALASLDIALMYAHTHS